jgi:hypothetical protein
MVYIVILHTCEIFTRTNYLQYLCMSLPRHDRYEVALLACRALAGSRTQRFCQCVLIVAMKIIRGTRARTEVRAYLAHRAC